MKLSRGGLILSGIYVIFFAVVYSLTFVYDHKTAYLFLMLSVFPAFLLSLVLYWLIPSSVQASLDIRCDTALCETLMGFGTLAAHFLISLLMAYLAGWALERFIILMSTAPRTTRRRQ